MKVKGHVPIRRCIGCGSRRKKEEMIRLVRDVFGTLRMNRKGIEGRGFYLCRDLACLEAVRKKRKRSGFLGSVDLESLTIGMVQAREKREEVEWQR